MKKLMLGNEAVARGVFEAGTTVVSSYPGTPSTEITEAISKYDEIYSEWAPNEKVALEVASGASIAGARAFSAMKHVGLNVAADPLFTMSYIGSNGGLVIAVADDPGMHSSQNEQDSRHYAKASKTVMLEPADSQEAKDYTIKAFDISEEFDTPVIIRLSTRISHSQSIVELGERQEIELKEYTYNPAKNVMMPAMGRKRHIFVEERIKKLEKYSNESGINTIEIKDHSIGIISSGISYQYAKEVFPDASFLKIGMPYPLPDQMILEFASKVHKIIVIEELDPVIEEHCKILGIQVTGKNKLPLCGEYSADLLGEKLLGTQTGTYSLNDEILPVRPPVMCNGCPHRGLFYSVNKLNLIVTGDIGCYTLGALPPLNALDTCICMGAGFTAAHGFNKARGDEFSKKVIGIMGDSTFTHSGMTGLVDIVYNKGVSTVLILDNSITGMTGHQNNPVNGFTIKGEPTKQVNLEKLAYAIGFERVTVIDPFDVDNTIKVLREETNVDEPSLIIVQRPCALLKSVKYSGHCEVDYDKCRRCMQCMKIGCPAISDVDGKIIIDETQCVGCGLCVNVCKFGAMSVKEDCSV
ncbi:MAG: indolepyruvate ferredoxin oxidoreductase subunit alpha [Clostridiales bacterium]|nr:indolepyruvate ferredoxin oxidoreductase subunit alpha [Clostridiales bacterium]